MGESAIDRYVCELEAELEAVGVPRRRRAVLLAECRRHLELEAAHLLHEDGPSAGKGSGLERAAARAVERFGSAAELARAWARADRSSPVAAGRRLLAGSLVSLAVAVPLALPAARLADAWFGMMLLLPAAGLAFGAAVGAGQGWALERAAAGSLRWAAGTALGLALGITFGTVAVEHLGLERDGTLGELLGVALLGIVAGATTAALQGAFVRLKGAGLARWVAASAAGFSSGLVAGATVSAAAGRPPSLSDLPWFLACGVVGATASALLHTGSRAALRELSGASAC